MLFGGLLEVAKAFAIDLALEGANGAVVYREAVVWNYETVVDLNDTPEASAFRAGPEGRVEREERWDGCAEGLACDWRAKPVGEVCDWLYICIEYLNTTLSEMEGLLRGFDEAGANLVVQDRDPILYDKE